MQSSWNQRRTAELLQIRSDKVRDRMNLYNIVSEWKRGSGRPGDNGNSGGGDHDPGQRPSDRRPRLAGGAKRVLKGAARTPQIPLSA